MKHTLRLAFIKANWHSEIVTQALVGFRERLADCSNNIIIDVFEVPGAFEMPLQAQMLAVTGCYDAIVAAALVVDGGIYRHDFVANAVIYGLMQAQLATGVPILSVSLTPHHFQPTEEHTKFFSRHFIQKGREAAEATLAVCELRRQNRD